jgi:hypothetical protein
MLEPALIEPEETAFPILVIYLHLLAGHMLEVLVLMAIIAHHDLLDVVKHSFQLIQADIVLMLLLMRQQILLYFVVLIDTKTRFNLHSCLKRRNQC